MNLTNYLSTRLDLDELETLKLRRGLEVLSNNLMKTFWIYGLSFVLGITGYTLIVHLSYFAIRFFAFGAHFQSSFVCTLQSILMFVLIPWLLIHMHLYNLTVITLLSGLIICIYSPMPTRKHPLKSSWRRHLKYKAVFTAFLLFSISLMLSPSLSVMIQLGIILEAISLLPVFYKEDFYDH